MDKVRDGFAGHEVAVGAEEWLTPPHIIESLGPFDLDPCSPVNRPWDTAKRHYTKEDDGLSKEWEGSVWCNPPYGRETAKWLKRCMEHGDAVALVFARTETKMFRDFVWGMANGIFFIDKRVKFCLPDGGQPKTSAGAPSALIVYGEHNASRILNPKNRIDGTYVHLWTQWHGGRAI